MSLAALLESLPIPILQSPMVGASDAALALAVGRAGGLGALAAATLAPDEIAPAVQGLRQALGAAPFSVNLLMAPKATPEAGVVDAALARLKPWYDKLGQAPPDHPNQFAHDFEAQLDALTAAAPPIASFTFDVLRRAQVDALHRAGSYVVGTATCVAEARAWADAGADGISAQGSEAGGHRGNFRGEIEETLVGTFALVGAIRAELGLPVIAAGGIMDGHGVAAALALGAAAAQMGTAFLLADEAVTPAAWRAAILAAPDDPTRLTRAFTGRWARGLENDFMREMRGVEREVPAYPVQNRLTQPLRAAAAKAGDAQVMSLWAGQGVRQAAPGSAEAMMRHWWAQASEAARALSLRTRGSSAI
jgi:nitronate monooxygenase